MGGGEGGGGVVRSDLGFSSSSSSGSGSGAGSGSGGVAGLAGADFAEGLAGLNCERVNPWLPCSAT